MDTVLFTPEIYDEDCAIWADTYFPTANLSPGIGQKQSDLNFCQTADCDFFSQSIGLEGCGAMNKMSGWEESPPVVMNGVGPPNDTVNGVIGVTFRGNDQLNIGSESEIVRLQAILEKQKQSAIPGSRPWLRITH